MKYLFVYFTILLLFICGCTTQDTSKDDFNIVLITIDALRADHLSCYGYERKTSPNIDKIAEKGILFKNVIAPSSWTAPSMVSLFTSTYPINHGVIQGFVKKQKVTQKTISSELTTLPEILKEHGYSTFGIASNPHLGGEFGFARGFDIFKHCSFPNLPASSVNQIIYSWKDQIEESEKFFLWIHYWDPHHPYRARSPWIAQYTSKTLTQKLKLSQKTTAELWQLTPMLKKDHQARSNLIALYDSEINFVDFHLGELINKFGLDKNTLLIITSDHGEEFLEHGFIGHARNLFQETIHIPLIIKSPYTSQSETIDEHVNLVDVMPTILQILNIAPPEQIEGNPFWRRNRLFPQLRDMLLGKEQYSFAELDKGGSLKAIITSEWKYIYDYHKETEQLYHINSDPKEFNNLAEKDSRQSNQLKEHLFNWASNSKKYPTKSQMIQLSREEKEQLEALGYLQTQ